MLDWHHAVLRQGAGFYFYTKYVAPRLGKNIPKEVLTEKEALWEKAKTQLNERLVGKKYVCGDDVTIADIAALSELYHFVYLCKLDMSAYPNI